MKHALIVGARGVGKSTLINRVLEELNRPVFGFATKKEPELRDQEFGDPIFIHEFGKSRHYSDDNLMGYCKDCRFNTMSGRFDRYAPNLMLPVSSDSVICFDELGFMESQEEQFCNAVFSRLDEDIPVIAAVKDKDFPFLNAVRRHPKCQCFFITEENREELFHDVLQFMKSSLK